MRNENILAAESKGGKLMNLIDRLAAAAHDRDLYGENYSRETMRLAAEALSQALTDQGKAEGACVDCFVTELNESLNANMADCKFNLDRWHWGVLAQYDIHDQEIS